MHYDDTPHCADHPARPAVRGVLRDGRALCVPCHLRAMLPSGRWQYALINYYAKESAAQCRKLMGGHNGR